jgi:hypothetical protein
MADLLVAMHAPGVSVPLGNILPGLAANFRGYSPGAEFDLQTSEARGTNMLYPDPTQLKIDGGWGIIYSPKAFSVASDADSVGTPNQKIDSAALAGDEGYPYRDAPNAGLNVAVQNSKYQFLGKIRSVSLSNATLFGRRIISVVTFEDTPVFERNDLAVTVRSSQFDGFVPLAPDPPYNTFLGIPVFRKNHKTVGSPSVAEKVMDAIRSAEAQPGTAAQ